MNFKILRAVYFVVALVGAVVAGVHHFVGLLQDCRAESLVVCVWQVASKLWPQSNGKPLPPVQAPTPDKPAPPEREPQTPALEALLIWTGHLDGEVGRITRADFEKAVSRFQASFGSGSAGGKLSASQRKALDERTRGARAQWQFRKVQDPLAVELWLPTALLPTGKGLKYGRRYESEEGGFSVDVAQFHAPEWSLEMLKDRHARGAGARKLEGQINERSEGGVSGFALSAIDGNERISVRAFQRDNVIRLLAITYRIEGDKDYRILRNAIGSSYVPFGPLGAPPRESRPTACSSGSDCAEKSARNVWNEITGDR